MKEKIAQIVRIVTIVLIVSISTVSPLFSQHTKSQVAENEYKVYPMEITIGVGFMPSYPGVEVGSLRNGYIFDDKLNEIYDNSVTTQTFDSPSFNLGFSYNINKLWSLGAKTSYATKTYHTNYIYDRKLVLDERITSLGLAPTVRLSWLNRKYVNLYSSASLGFSFIRNHDRVNNNTVSHITALADLTLIGVKVGGRVYGFSEFSISTVGVIKFGIGFRFGEK